MTSPVDIRPARQKNPAILALGILSYLPVASALVWIGWANRSNAAGTIAVLGLVALSAWSGHFIWREADKKELLDSAVLNIFCGSLYLVLYVAGSALIQATVSENYQFTARMIWLVALLGGFYSFGLLFGYAKMIWGQSKAKADFQENNFTRTLRSVAIEMHEHAESHLKTGKTYLLSIEDPSYMAHALKLPVSSEVDHFYSAMVFQTVDEQGRPDTGPSLALSATIYDPLAAGEDIDFDSEIDTGETFFTYTISPSEYRLANFEQVFADFKQVVGKLIQHESRINIKPGTIYTEFDLEIKINDQWQKLVEGDPVLNSQEVRHEIVEQGETMHSRICANGVVPGDEEDITLTKLAS